MNSYSKTKKVVFFFSTSVLLVLLFVISLGSGAVSINISDIYGSLVNMFSGVAKYEIDYASQIVIGELRLPRAVLAFIIGASLSVTGAVMQGLFRNPLADPALIGVSSGAATGAVIAIVLGAALINLQENYILSRFIIPTFAFVGGLISTILAYKLSTRQGRTLTGMLLLAGIAINAVNAAIYGFFLFIADDAQLRTITFWTLGSLANSTWDIIGLSSILIIIPTLFLMTFGRTLNIISLGEHEAFHLGVDVEKTKKQLIIVASIIVGVGVSVAGIISFVGLVIPHFVRLIVGPDYKIILPASFLLGAALLLGADSLARVIVLPAELPLGILTTGIGGPFFIWLLLRQKHLREL